MKLNKQQLERIRTFILQLGFTAIDLQMEIIDHVACSIEEKMGEDPALTFEEALQQTYSEFSVSEFSELETVMAKSLRKKYFHQVCLEFKRWMTFPIVLVVGGFGLVLYQLFFWIATPWLLAIVWSVYFAFSLGVFLYNWWLQRRYRKLMVMKFANQFVFLPTQFVFLSIFFFQIEGGWSAISNQLTRYPEAAWIYACLYVCVTLFFTFLFAAFFRIISYATRKCREFERQGLLF